MPFASVDSQTPEGYQLNARREGARSRMRPRSILHQSPTRGQPKQLLPFLPLKLPIQKLRIWIRSESTFWRCNEPRQSSQHAIQESFQLIPSIVNLIYCCHWKKFPSSSFTVSWWGKDWIRRVLENIELLWSTEVESVDGAMMWKGKHVHSSISENNY